VARSSSPRSGTASTNAFITEVEEPGDGIRLGVKDLFDTAGIRTTYGSAIFAGHVPDRTAGAVSRLEAAGYAVVGKTNLHEFAYGITSENEHFGDVGNPLADDRYPGGSSGGSAAALAAGLCDAALGTDSAGSIRIPAACCGVVGFKPTHGLVAMDGCWPLAPSFDTTGPMGRDVATCAAMMKALEPGLDSTPVALGDVRVAVAWLDDADARVREQVAESAGCFPRQAEIDFPPMPANIDPAFQREVADVHRDLFAEHADLYGANVRWKVERALAVTDEDYESSAAARKAYRDRAAEALEGFDLLLVPTIGTVAPPRTLAERDLRPTVLRFTEPFNVLGWPAIALPCGPAEAGLPASVSVVGRAGDDALVLGAALALERYAGTAASPRTASS
jgi:aspartyl-tRNA(Asn)/glutamyl-tRNA(Gln) amidotransferase subunit A